MERGAKLKLEDGSVWEIARKDQAQVINWRISQKISVSSNPSDRYPFKLTNTYQNTTADARLAVPPKLAQLFVVGCRCDRLQFWIAPCGVSLNIACGKLSES